MSTPDGQSRFVQVNHLKITPKEKVKGETMVETVTLFWLVAARSHNEWDRDSRKSRFYWVGSPRITCEEKSKGRKTIEIAGLVRATYSIIPQRKQEPLLLIIEEGRVPWFCCI